MVSPTQWTWVWVNSRSWWWTGRPGVLQSMGSQSQTWLSDWTLNSVYSCLLTSSGSVRSIPFLSFIVPICMKCSLGISNFLEEISSLFHYIAFLYFFALITEEGFLISPCYSLELCIQIVLFFLFSFAFCILKRWKHQITWPASWETCTKVKKQQLELDMEQQTGSKSGKKYIKAVYI